MKPKGSPKRRIIGWLIDGAIAALAVIGRNVFHMP
jgi:hypothetical protein